MWEAKDRGDLRDVQQRMAPMFRDISNACFRARLRRGSGSVSPRFLPSHSPLIGVARISTHSFTVNGAGQEIAATGKSIKGGESLSDDVRAVDHELH